MLRDNNKKRRIVVVGKGGSGGGIDQVQSDWNQTDNTQVDFIKNKPTVYNEWFGTQLEYDAISVKDPDTIYYIEDASGTVVRDGKTYGIKVQITNPELEDLSVTANGTYQSSTKYGYDEVTVNVQPNLTTLNATANDTYTPTAPVQGYSSVTVNVPAPQLTTLNATTNNTFTPSSPYVGYSEVTVNVSPSLQDKTVTQNGTVTADQGYDGLGTVTVNVQPAPEYFYVENVTPSASTLSITGQSGTAPAITVYKSTDQTNWESMGTTSETPITATIPANSKLYLKATANAWAAEDWYAFNYNRIDCTSYFKVGGYIASLLFGDNFENAVMTSSNSYAFVRLFSGANNVVSAADLKFPSSVSAGCYIRMFENCANIAFTPQTLPAMTLADDCYSAMFQYCSLLTTAPALPATTLGDRCYQQMFDGCSKLTVAPALPATTATEACYANMFQYSGLTKAPSTLPATTLGYECYRDMFKGTPITTSPAIMATTMAERCCVGMFYECSSLNSVTIYADDISASDCMHDWLGQVAASGTVYNYGSAVYPTDSADGIPQGWTEQSM